MRIPAPLKPGDRVALIAPSSPLPGEADLPLCIKAAEELGLDVRPYPTTELAVDYMAGTAKQKARDIHKAFADPKVRGILCLRGGYSACHVLPLLDWKSIAADPKIFTGFSDITALLTPFATRAGLASLHAPTMSYFKKRGPLEELSFTALKRFLFEPWSGLSYRDLAGRHFVPTVLAKGTASGRLIGGNLSVFHSMIGTPYLKKKGGPYILFLEEIGEKPYALDRFLTQMIQAGFFDQVSGVVLGQFTSCDPKAPDTGTALEVIGRLLAPLRIPVLAGIPIGHSAPSFPLPIGVKAELDTKRGDLVLKGKG